MATHIAATSRTPTTPTIPETHEDTPPTPKTDAKLKPLLKIPVSRFSPQGTTHKPAKSNQSNKTEEISKPTHSHSSSIANTVSDTPASPTSFTTARQSSDETAPQVPGNGSAHPPRFSSRQPVTVLNFPQPPSSPRPVTVLNFPQPPSSPRPATSPAQPSLSPKPPCSPEKPSSSPKPAPSPRQPPKPTLIPRKPPPKKRVSFLEYAKIRSDPHFLQSKFSVRRRKGKVESSDSSVVSVPLKSVDEVEKGRAGGEKRMTGLRKAEVVEGVGAKNGGTEGEENLGVPLVKIDVIKGRTPEEVRKLADCVQSVLEKECGVSKGDRLQIVTQHEPGEMICEDAGVGDTRTDSLVFLQIFQQGRDAATKQQLHRALAEALSKECGLRGEDLIVTCSATSKEDWSFGKGRAQPPEGSL